MPADGLEGLVGQVVLDLAGILTGYFLRNAQPLEHLGQDGVAQIYAVGDGFSRRGQGQQVVVIHQNVAVFPQFFHGDADGGLGDPQRGGHVDGAGIPFFFLQHQDHFQIILTGFVNLHGRASFITGIAFPILAQSRGVFKPSRFMVYWMNTMDTKAWEGEDHGRSA